MLTSLISSGRGTARKQSNITGHFGERDINAAKGGKILFLSFLILSVKYDKKGWQSLFAKVGAESVTSVIIALIVTFSFPLLLAISLGKAVVLAFCNVLLRV